MQKDDIIVGAGSLASAVFAFFSWLWSIPFLQFGFTFILGTLVTYSIQSKLQDRADKRKKTTEKIEKIYGPLRNELRDYKKDLIEELNVSNQGTLGLDSLGQTRITQWERVKTFPEYFSISSKLKEEMEEITKTALNMTSILDEAKRAADFHLLNSTEEILKKNFEKDDVYVVKENSFSRTLYISARSDLGKYLGLCMLHDCLLLDENPIEHMKRRFPDFSPSLGEFSVFVHTNTMPGQGKIKEFKLTEKHLELDSIFKNAQIKAKKDKTISKLMEEKSELSLKIGKLLPRIEKYIEKHYPVEEI